jgi:hypothetical protein
MLPNITDYWDERVEAIERLSRMIAAVPEAERGAQLSAIVAAVERQAAALPDEILTKYAVPIVEDLYKAVTKRTYLDEPLLQYLAASCRPFFQALAARGYAAHYFIDNTWDRLDGPALGFPMWFDAVGLQYICPQEIACRRFEQDKPREEWPALVTKYIDDGRAAAKELATRCAGAGRSFVYLDIDAADFEIAVTLGEGPGVIFIFRQEAPVPGSRCTIRMPDGPRAAPPQAPAGPAPDATPNTDDFEMLLGVLRQDDANKRKFFRDILKDQIGNVLAAAATEANIAIVKATLVGFQDAGWERVQSNVEEGLNTVADAIYAVLAACARNPRAKDLLTIVVDSRVRSVTDSPAAATPNPIPSFANLIKAVKQADAISKAG